MNAASTTTLTVTPSSGYVISSVTGCGGTLSGNTYTTAAINAPCTVTASFVAQYVVTATAGVRGTISPPSATVNAGGTTTLTVTPMAGYLTSGVTGCGGTLSGNTYTTGAINSNCTVTANFSAAFTWISGPNTGNGRGIYGTQGVAAATNMPGPRDKAAAWTDKSGQQWLFGGEGYDSSGTFGGLNDLWEYSPSSGEWTWVGGSNTVNATGVYGTQGLPAKTNVPGGRFGPATWTDANGNLWKLGGWVNLGSNHTGTICGSTHRRAASGRGLVVPAPQMRRVSMAFKARPRRPTFLVAELLRRLGRMPAATSGCSAGRGSIRQALMAG